MSKARQLADLGNQVDDGAITGTNMVINGAMTVAQRGVSFSSLSASQYCLDRFSNDIGGGGAITVSQSSTTPVNFKNSMSLTVATNDTSIAGADAYRITHVIEGQNAAQLNWGTSDARTITLSFWVRSSVTGTYGLGLANSAETENYIAEYTISAANTWEYKTITIEGRTSGTWLDTNGAGIGIRWDLGSGTNYNGTAGTWQTTGGKVYRTSSCVNWIATSGATFYITGVCLNVGDSAIDFPHESYGDTLAKCQRYTYIISGAGYTPATDSAYARYFMFGTGSTTAKWLVPFPVSMKSTPSLIKNNFTSSTVQVYSYTDDAAKTLSSISLAEGGISQSQVNFTVSGAGDGHILTWRWNNSPAAYIGFEAEL